jgi:hypothetical protein
MDKLRVSHVLEEFSTFCWTRWFITAFKTALCWIHYVVQRRQLISFHQMFSRSVLLILFHIRRGIPIGFFPACLATKLRNSDFLNACRYMACPTRSPWCNRPNIHFRHQQLNYTTFSQILLPLPFLAFSRFFAVSLNSSDLGYSIRGCNTI